MPPQADVILFNQRQLPYRGVADEELKGIVRPLWRKGKEWRLAKLLNNAPLETGGWWDDASDIDQMFDRFRGEYVGVGPTLAWWESDHADMRSGPVPLEGGTLKRGVY